MKFTRQQAFGSNRKMLKGCLHCHTTRSDGHGTPEEVIRLFEKNGYDFLSLTDHRIYNYENFAPETSVIIVPGMEYNSSRFVGFNKGCRCFHTVAIGPSREDGNLYEQDQTVDTAGISGQEEYQPFLDEIHEHGNMTILAHPEWSGTTVDLFEKLKGDFAMEIWNTESAVIFNMDKDAPYWDQMLGKGIRIYGVASDDSHYMRSHCKGWVMVNAEKDLNSILKALKEGAFYSSTGPIIKDFYVDGDRVHIECSEVYRICMHSADHPGTVCMSDNDDLTSADFTINQWPHNYQYVRITVYAKNGTRAWTNPIWIENDEK